MILARRVLILTVLFVLVGVCALVVAPGALAQSQTAQNEIAEAAPGEVTPNNIWPPAAFAFLLSATTGASLLVRRKNNLAEQADQVDALDEPDGFTSEGSSDSAERPRFILLDGQPSKPTTGGTGRVFKPRRIELQRQESESTLSQVSALTKIMEELTGPKFGPTLGPEEFARRVDIEWSRHRAGGSGGAVASLTLSELDAVRLRLGAAAADDVFGQVAHTIKSEVRALDVLCRAGDSDIAILMPAATEREIRNILDQITKRIAGTTFNFGDERVLLTPAIGFAMLSDADSSTDLIRAADRARSMSNMDLDLHTDCLLYTSPSPRDATLSRMPSSA